MFLAQQTSPLTLSPVEPVLFLGLAALVVLSAWAIVLSQNIVRMAVYLLLTLAGAAGFFFMLDAEFLAAIQLIVYAGGTLILIVFGVMLTSKNPFMQFKSALWERGVGALVALLVAGLMLFAMINSALPSAPIVATRGGAEAGYDQVALIGRLLLTNYLVPFEVSAVLLLVVMVGAAYMARRGAK